ncbi:hypothetical protein COT97_05730 [Candidatus Falkowbacteria bacterium CG10_big_fil_rev_8_21_14_0_10_39_11]|uniref:LemA family protein n=1 Tax=Candidatus Falkowbacteria bacterium CG10_big_fil_rev_8_21_14_0_10_39_11 TaxID=1974565 RepID=A0A2H0V3D3_9BACT|nr:MAG: hypothetical protein COT97_05730 [Candidatus Falkowbacteria bacterium CG10_big_fil_rev_8_21_14_0_10_39_11]
MILLVIFAFCLIAMFVLFYLDNHKQVRDDEDFYEIMSFVSVFMAIVAGFVVLITNVVCYLGQVDQLEQVTELAEKQVIYQEKADQLVAEFESYLVTTYPEYETEMVGKLHPSSIMNVLFRYPSLRTASMVKDYVEKMSVLWSAVYTNRLKQAKLKRDIFILDRNPFVLSFIMPSIPTDWR